MLDSVLPAEMCRTLTGLMFSIMMDAECEIEDAELGSQAPADQSPPEMDHAPSAKNGYAPQHVGRSENSLTHASDAAGTTSALRRSCGSSC